MTGAVRGYTGGTFDLFHPGHAAFLRQCRERCDHLTVGLNTDAFAERYKRRPVMTLAERLIVLEACRYVDQVIVNTGGEDSRAAILTAKPDLIFHGDDWTGPGLLEQLGITEGWLERQKITMAYVPYTPAISTSQLLERLAS